MQYKITPPPFVERGLKNVAEQWDVDVPTAMQYVIYQMLSAWGQIKLRPLELPPDVPAEPSPVEGVPGIG